MPATCRCRLAFFLHHLNASLTEPCISKTLSDRTLGSYSVHSTTLPDGDFRPLIDGCCEHYYVIKVHMAPRHSRHAQLPDRSLILDTTVCLYCATHIQVPKRVVYTTVKNGLRRATTRTKTTHRGLDVEESYAAPTQIRPLILPLQLSSSFNR